MPAKTPQTNLAVTPSTPRAIELPEDSRIDEDVAKLKVKKDEFIKCFRYITMRETDWSYTHVDTARALNITAQGLYAAIHRWEKNGLLDWVRENYFVPMYAESIRVIQRRVMAKWDQVIAHQLKTAIGGPGISDQFSLQAAQFLHETIVVPEVQRLEEAGKSPQQLFLQHYNKLREKAATNPMSVGKPPALPESVVDAEVQEIE